MKSPPNSIQRRIFLLIVGVFLTLTGSILIVFDNSLERDLMFRESEQAQRDLQIFESLLSQKSDMLSSSLEAWCKWDDMANFVGHPSEEFRQTNFNFGALNPTNADILAIYNGSGALIDGYSVDRSAGVINTISSDVLILIDSLPSLKNHRDLFNSRRAYVNYHGRVMLLVASAIAKTAITPPAVGTGIIGRFLLEEEVASLGASLHLKATVETNLGRGVPSNSIERNSDFYFTRLPLQDSKGDTVAAIRLTTRRDDYRNGKQTRNLLLVIVTLCGTIALGIMIFMLRKLVTERFLQFKNQLRLIAENPLGSERLALNSDDEFSELAEDVNCVLAKLSELRSDAEKANAVKSRFLANMSHEVRTPINGISGMLDLFWSTPMTAEQREYVATAQSSARDLLQIVNDILDFSKIDANKLKIEASSFSLKDLVHDLTLTCEVLAKKKGLVSIVEMSDRLPEHVCGDKLKIKQIILNLLTNAIKFTSQGAVIFMVRLGEASNGDTAEVEFSICDTGHGFDMADVERLFQPFEQGSVVSSGVAGGTGLGLPITRQLSQLLSGSLIANSRPGIGSRFTFSLCLEKVAMADSVQEKVEWWKKDTTRQLDILVAEDNQVNQLLMRRILEKLGHRVTIVSDGAEAVTSCRGNTFDLVLMDLQMPNMNGLEALRELQKNSETSSLPVIAVTAHAGEEERGRCISAGMKGYVTKPMNVLNLIETINAVTQSV